LKNGWAYRNVVDVALPDLLALEGAAFLAGRFELLNFLAIDLSPKMPGVLDVHGGSGSVPIVNRQVYLRRRRCRKQVYAVQFGNMPRRLQWSRARPFGSLKPVIFNTLRSRQGRDRPLFCVLSRGLFGPGNYASLNCNCKSLAAPQVRRRPLATREKP
jgi:hypothetical protein